MTDLQAKDGSRSNASGQAGWQEVCGLEECSQAGGTCRSRVGGRPLQDLGLQVGVNIGKGRVHSGPVPGF